MAASPQLQALKDSFGRHVEGPLDGFLSELGERHGIDWLIYNPLRMRMFHRYARRDAAAVIGAIEAVLPECATYADVGSGSGAFASEAQRRQHPIVAYERSFAGRFMARRQGVDCRDFDLRLGSGGVALERTHLAYSFEVAEHLTPPLGDRLVEFLTLIAPTIVFTAAQPGQGGTAHVNEQPREYWRDRFAAKGFFESQDLTTQLSATFEERGVQGFWFARNVGVYKAREANRA
jgi:hypothetical protein